MRSKVWLLVALCVATTAVGDSKNPADYPLRLHIYSVSGVTFFHNRVTEEVKGDGRASLFENSEPRGVEFSFDCAQKIKTSFEFETYPAKWKKKPTELLVLFPVTGKANAHFTCTLKTDLKTYAYFVRNGRLESESPAQFKSWMVSHAYDPEHGKNTPTAGAATRLDEARSLLTGSHKDPEQASKLLRTIIEVKGEGSPEELVWAYIYLGYIEDRAKNRQTAVSLYEKAVAVDGASSGSLNLAKFGLKQPLTWIRHLDAGERP
jgi:hypothetical protein